MFIDIWFRIWSCMWPKCCRACTSCISVPYVASGSWRQRSFPTGKHQRKTAFVVMRGTSGTTGSVLVSVSWVLQQPHGFVSWAHRDVTQLPGELWSNLMAVMSPCGHSTCGVRFMGWAQSVASKLTNLPSFHSLHCPPPPKIKWLVWLDKLQHLICLENSVCIHIIYFPDIGKLIITF